MNRETSTFQLSHFSKILKPVTKKVLGKHGTTLIDIISNWKSIVGDEIGAYTLPQSLKHKNKQQTSATLVVAVKSAAFGLEICAKKSIIIQKISAYFGYQAVGDIATIVADIMSPNFEEDEKKLVTKEEVDYINTQASDIQSEALQNALKKLGTSIIRKNKK